MSFATIRSQPLRASLRRADAITSWLSAAKPDHDAVALLRGRPRPGCRDCAPARARSRRPPAGPPCGSCAPRARAGRKSATAAALITTSRLAAAPPSTASRISSARLDVDARARPRASASAHRPGDQHHLGAAPRRLGGDREAHLPGRAVAEEAHGVDALARAAGRHQHAQRPRGPRVRAGARAAAAIAPGSAMRPSPSQPQASSPRLGAHEARAALAQHARRSRASRRAATCSRSSRARAAAARASRARRSSTRSSARPCGEARQGVRGGRRHQQQLRPVGQRDVVDLALLGRDRRAGCAPARRSGVCSTSGVTNSSAARRRDAAHLVALAPQRAHQLGHLVGGDAAA